MPEGLLVSILMTAYNREQYIGEAIESVLASTYRNFELIIVDDASTDNTVSIAKSYEIKDSRINVYINDINLGDYPNRNKAAGYARGEWMLYVDSDDKLHTDGIQNCLTVLEKYPYSSFAMRIFAGETDAVFELTSTAAIQTHFFKRGLLSIGPGGTLIRRAFFEEIQKYPVKYGPANDMYFNLKAACNTSVVFIPFDFLFYRRHEGQEINNQYSYLYNNYLYLKDAIRELPLPLNSKQLKWIDNKNKRRFVVNIKNYFFKKNDLGKTLKAIKLAGFSIKDLLQGIFH